MTVCITSAAARRDLLPRWSWPTAFGLALLARDRGGPALAGQMLLWPDARRPLQHSVGREVIAPLAEQAATGSLESTSPRSYRRQVHRRPRTGGSGRTGSGTIKPWAK